MWVDIQIICQLKIIRFWQVLLLFNLAEFTIHHILVIYLYVQRRVGLRGMRQPREKWKLSEFSVNRQLSVVVVVVRLASLSSLIEWENKGWKWFLLFLVCVAPSHQMNYGDCCILFMIIVLFLLKKLNTSTCVNPMLLFFASCEMMCMWSRCSRLSTVVLLLLLLNYHGRAIDT